MPSKKNRAKASKQQSHSFYSIKSHKENTPDWKKMRMAEARYLVQRQLGRDIKRYNLLYTTNEGDMFSSEDNLSEILDILRSKSVNEPINCGGWSLMYKLNCNNMPEDKQFFMYANLSDTPFTRNTVSINKFDYFVWKELVSS